jgi:glycosyltransferase involved in cell wall biosynthesis
MREAAASRIEVNASVLGEHPTGLGVYTREVVRGLIAQGRLEGASVYTSAPDGLVEMGRDVRIVPVQNKHTGTAGHIARLVWLQTGFRASVVRDRADLIYSTVPEGIMRLPPGIRQVITVHDIIPVRFPVLHRNLVWYYRAVVPMLLRSSAAVICNSEYTKADLLKWCGLSGLDVQVVSEGFDVDTFAAMPVSGEAVPRGLESPYLLWVGDMRPYKNLERVLTAFARIRKPGMSLAVVGKTDARFYPAILETTQRLGLAGSVRFLGYVSDSELACLYRHAVALVFASLYEGFGLPPLEAMASGCPVIASDVTSVPEVCADAALYVDPYSVDDIVRGMSIVLESAALQEELRSAGLERAQKFSWTRASGRIGEILGAL